ncbi:MAG: primosomal protein N', partial [Comamonadaceae bacterium]
MTSAGWEIGVAVQTPAHSGIGHLLSYDSPEAVAPGSLLRVPLGAREVLGVAWRCTSGGGAMRAPAAADGPVATATSNDPSDGDAVGPPLRPIAAVLSALAPLSDAWRDLVEFAAAYYQRSLGEVALAALPPQLRDLSALQLARRLKRRADATASTSPPAVAGDALVEPSQEQSEALASIESEAGPFLLFGSTGSGKTEVYLRSVAALLAREPDAQALVMVPEINLTPQLEARFAARFGADAVVSLHSGMTNPQRLASWLSAHAGRARIVLGTRMAVFASMPQLRLIVVDEEHDPSYKQQEGARYSARDLAVWRGRREGAKVILGSATPSLESWYRSRPAEPGQPGGTYVRLPMPSRIGAGALPTVRVVDMAQQPARTVISAGLLDAIGQRIARGEQSMVFLNRRGYAPVLACGDCGWKSECPHCSAYR